MVTAYPFLYYAVVACFQRLASVFGSGPAVLFLAARLLSVIFFACSLLLSYKICRELRLRKSLSLVVIAIVAFFPLSTFVSASVQPDNLTLLLVLLCSYLALLLGCQETNGAKLIVLLGLALGALLVTKYHIFLFTAVAVFGKLISEHFSADDNSQRSCDRSRFCVVPSILLFAVQLWIVWGGGQITGGNLHPASAGAGVRN